MFSIRNAAIGLAAIAATGCALPGPQISYSASETPHSQTAVIMKDPRADGVLVTITQVNGNKTACFSQGCPIWVRVLPGPIKISIDLDIYEGTGSYRGKYDLEVVAEPLHTGIGYSDGFEIRGSIVRPTF